MNRIYDEILFNINSFGIFPTIIVLVFFIITFVIFTILFHRVVIIQYSILIQVMMAFYLCVFLVVVNSTNAYQIFQLTRVLYTTFMILSVTCIFTVSHIATEDLYILKIFSIVSSVIIIALIYINDTWMITREIQVTSYYATVKGPLFPLAIIYILLIGTIMIINYFLLYKKRPDDMKKLWPIFAGIIFFTFYTNFQGILLYIQPHLKPQLYIPVIVFQLLFLFYIFSEVKLTIMDREKMYRAYLYDDLTNVHTRNFILEEINEALELKRISHQYIAMIDIDGFKKINDTYGHLLGDKVLKAFGKLLNEIDVEDTIAGRLGGDEFIIYFRNTNEEEVLKCVKELLKSYTLALININVDASRVQSGLSIGIIKIHSSMTLKDVLTQADKTMYGAKKSGKNTIRVLDHQLVST